MAARGRRDDAGAWPFTSPSSITVAPETPFGSRRRDVDLRRVGLLDQRQEQLLRPAQRRDVEHFVAVS